MTWHRALAAVLGLALALISTPAHADATLAVLPLDKAAASDEYAGLGKALAGMLVTDLSQVPGVTLVERDRLQAVMDELSLSETDFVDETTAQQLGKGLGAKFVLTGSYSVVAQTFVLDARVVEVETGAIRKAADASGDVADFVTVEKDLVEALVEGLGVELSSSVRRKVLMDAPTEDFGAFTAYGEGLESVDQGDLEAAREAFERAIDRDPEFEAARSSLNQVKALLDSYKAEKEIRYDTIYRGMNLRVLESTTDELTRAKSTADTQEIVVDLVLRLAALENEGLDCQRYQEMVHYLERVDWQVQEPPRPEGMGVLSYEAGKAAERMEFVRYEGDAGGPKVAHQRTDRAAKMWRSTPAFLFGPSRDEFGPSSMLDSLNRCMEPADRVAELDRIKGELRKRDMLQLDGGSNYDGVTVEDRLDVAWMTVHAFWLGPSDEMAKRYERLLERVRLDDPVGATDEEKERERWGLGALETIERDLGYYDRDNRRRLWLTDEESIRLLTAVSEMDATVIDMTKPACVTEAKRYQPSARSGLVDYQEELEEEDWFWARMSLVRVGDFYGPMRDMGCLIGTPAKFSSFDEVMAFSSAAAKTAAGLSNPIGGDDCLSMVNSVEMTVTAYEGSRQYLQGEALEQASMTLLSVVYNLERMGCLEEDQ